MSTRYFTGVPCPKGHVAERFTSNDQCLQCHAEYQRRWRQRHPDRMRSIKRKCYEKHAHAYRADSIRRHRQTDSPERRAAKATYDKSRRHQLRDRDRERSAAWRKANPERRRAVASSYKARRRSKEAGGVSSAELTEWIKTQPKVCYWCGVKCASAYHVDHYVPLSRDGRHVLSNLVIACPTCNVRKQATDPYEFAQTVGRLF